jgi:hypothetical protein
MLLLLFCFFKYRLFESPSLSMQNSFVESIVFFIERVLNNNYLARALFLILVGGTIIEATTVYAGSEYDCSNKW